MDRLYYQTLTVPAGTAIAAAVSQAWPLEDNQLEEITIEVPDGHCGLTGVRVLQAQQQIVPFANNSFFVANDRVIDYPFKDQITSTGLVIQGYNLDIFPHTFYLTALVANLPLPGENPEAEVVTSGLASDLSLLPPDFLNVSTILNTPGPEPVPPIPEPIPSPVVRQPGHKLTVSPYQLHVLEERKRQPDKAGA